MEQIFLYLAILAALSGFGMGMFNLASPYLKRRNITLPSLNLDSLLHRGVQRDDDEDDFDSEDEDLEDARDFEDAGFAADELKLLAKRRIVALDDEEELDEELASVLDEVAVAEPEADEDEEDPDEAKGDEDTYVYTIPAGQGADDDEPDEDDGAPANESDLEDVDTVATALDEDEEDEDEEDEDEGDEEDEDEGDEDEEDEGSAESTVHVVAGGAGGEGDDMLSFFNEAADAGAAAVAAWRQDLPEVSIEELLAEARTIRQQIHGKKSSAA